MSMPENGPVVGPTAEAQDADKFKTIALIVHGLNLATPLTGGFAAIVAVVIAYLKRGDAMGTIWESHMTWAIRSFWICILGTAICFVLTLILVGFLGLILLGIWWLVRAIMGLLKALDSKPMPNPESWLF